MHPNSTPPPFLGTCEVCGKPFRNYTALAQHLRHKNDPAHQDLKTRWHAWRAEYKATLRCRKCGDLFGITDKALKDSKRCPRCEHLRQTLSKRQYEALRFDKKPDPRTFNKAEGSKASWPVGYVPEVAWEVGGTLYTKVGEAIERGWGVAQLRDELGLQFSVVKAIVESILGVDGCAQWVLDRQVENIHRNRESARTNSKLEQAFVDQLASIGIEPCARNSWMTVTLGGQQVRREADIKVSVGDGRKVIVLCDGVAFHGPGCMYADPVVKTADDRATALAFYKMGYTVLRYSGDEIRSGYALSHFQRVWGDLTSHHRVYRNWHPLEEVRLSKGS